MLAVIAAQVVCVWLEWSIFRWVCNQMRGQRPGQKDGQNRDEIEGRKLGKERVFDHGRTLA